MNGCVFFCEEFFLKKIEISWLFFVSGLFFSGFEINKTKKYFLSIHCNQNKKYFSLLKKNVDDDDVDDNDNDMCFFGILTRNTSANIINIFFSDATVIHT